MKKIIVSIMVIVLGFFLGACSKEEKVYGGIDILVPFGTPLIAVGGLLGKDNINIEAVNDPSLLTAAMVTKEKDIIIAPITAGTASYIKGGSVYKMAGIVTLGNTYIVSRESSTLTSVNDLEGETITAYGRNNTPDIALKLLLDNANVTATIDYQNSVGDVVALFNGTTPPEYILVAEPFLTQLKNKNTLNVLNVERVLQEKDVLDNIYQAAIFVNPESVKEDLDHAISLIEQNLNSLNNNPESYAESVVDKHAYFTNLGVEVLKKSLPSANLDFVGAFENKTAIENYYNIINTYNDKLFNNQLPNSDFYYEYNK